MRPRSSLVRRIPLRVALVGATLAATIAATLAGCDLMVATVTPRPSRIVSTPEPTLSPEPTEDDEAPTLRPDPSGASSDLLDAANALADLRSYRVAVASRGLVEATPATATVTMTSTLLQGAEPAAKFSMAGVDGFADGRLDAIVIG